MNANFRKIFWLLTLFFMTNFSYSFMDSLDYYSGTLSSRSFTGFAETMEPISLAQISGGVTYVVTIQKRTPFLSKDLNELVFNVSKKPYNAILLNPRMLEITFIKVKAESPDKLYFDLMNLDNSDSEYSISVSSNTIELREQIKKELEEYERNRSMKEAEFRQREEQERTLRNEQEELNETTKFYTTLNKIIDGKIPFINKNPNTGDIIFKDGAKLLFSCMLPSSSNDNIEKNDDY